MKEIKLTRGFVALVDDEDYEYLNQWKWTYHSSGSAYRKFDGVDVFMHRLIMEAPGHLLVDNIDGNKLNNQRSNLRIYTKGQKPKKKNKNATSKYKGVSLDRGKWVAQIRIDGKTKHLGRYHTEEEAYTAYKKIAKEHFGEFFREM